MLTAKIPVVIHLLRLYVLPQKNAALTAAGVRHILARKL